jgi:6-phosphogluconolactonase (cycloisomerase 2 family)
MRMKFNKSGQLALVSAASLLAATLLTACGTLTVDFVFVASSKAAGTNNYGEIDVFEVDSESGHMRQIPTSPFPSGGRNPVAEAVSSDNTNLYVVNQDDNSIVQFVVGNDGKLYPQNTTNTDTSGIFPLAVAVNGSNLFVVDTYQPLPTCSSAEPCSGSIAVFPILAATKTGSDALGTPVANGSISYWPLTLPAKPTDVIVPTAVAVLPSGADVYVTAYDSSVSPSVGYVFGFAVGSGGALTPLNGGVPFSAGVLPSAIAAYSTSSSSFVYVTDATRSQVHAYSATSGSLAELSGSPFATGNGPSAVVADQTYPYLYIANALDGNVWAYSLTNGVPQWLGSQLSGGGTYTAGIQPIAIGIDPSTNHFLYTANFLSNTVSGFELSTTDGTLTNTQNSPFASSAQPTAVAAIPHGSTSK